MIVTYTPTGQEPQVWTWDPKNVRAGEAEDIEQAMGTPMNPVTFDEFQVALIKGGARARRVLLWNLQRKAHPTLKLADVDFAIGELKVEFETPELREMREAAAKAPRVDEAQRSAILEALDIELERSVNGDDTGGKAS